MKSPQWHDVLEPRGAVIAGVVGLAIVWPMGFYLSNAGYVLWGYTPSQYKNLATAVDLLAFAVPYAVTKWLLKRRQSHPDSSRKQR
jgi:multisubunit Na+/H+ antiporter MnhB subunit